MFDIWRNDLRAACDFHLHSFEDASSGGERWDVTRFGRLRRPTRGGRRERKERERGLHIKQHPLTQCRLCQVGGGEGPRWNARGGERRRRGGGMEKERREERSGGKAGRAEGSHQNGVATNSILTM